jgi:hypothetical protein
MRGYTDPKPTTGGLSDEELRDANMRHDRERKAHPQYWEPAPPGFDATDRRTLRVAEMDAIVIPWRNNLQEQAAKQNIFARILH